MYSLPSTSRSFAPWACCTKNGSPPTFLNARTGELTPPGKTACARSNSEWLLCPILHDFSNQVVLHRIHDSHVHEFARAHAWRVLDLNDSIDFQRLAAGSAGRTLVRDVVDQNLLH